MLNFHLPIGKSVDSVHTEKLKSAHASVLSRDVRSPQVMGGGVRVATSRREGSVRGAGEFRRAFTQTF